MMVKIYAIEIIFRSHEPFQSNQLTGPAFWKGLMDLKTISMAYIFAIIFVSKLVLNLFKNFLCIA